MIDGLSDENQAKHNAMVTRVNALSDEEVENLIKDNKCPYEPEHWINVPIGMFHCPVCGEMVVAGIKHGR